MYELTEKELFLIEKNNVLLELESAMARLRILLDNETLTYTEFREHLEELQMEYSTVKEERGSWGDR